MQGKKFSIMFATVPTTSNTELGMLNSRLTRNNGVSDRLEGSFLS